MRPRIFHADQHDIDFTQIDRDALEVIARLQEMGHEAFLVGGGVRDLLAKKRPKDFDISTSAKPEEIKQIFRRQCLLIGRRFRLAHIRFGQKVLEVSTFRAGENADELIVRDNEWGNAEEDATRRDFTINGLFYDPKNHQVIDYVGGWDDIHKGVLHTIGDPHVRFRQDPVRMIRLLKFRARFGFKISPDTFKALQECREEIVKSAPARVLEELLRMLESGSAEVFFQLLHEEGFLEMLLPWLDHFLSSAHGEDVRKLLKAADQVNQSREPQSPLDRAVLLSCITYPVMMREIEMQHVKKDKFPHMGEIAAMSHGLMQAISTSSFSHFPRRLSASIAFVLTSQYRLTPLQHKPSYRLSLMRSHEFPLAMDFFQLRLLADSTLDVAYSGWSELFEQVKKQPHHQTPHPDQPPARDAERTVRRRRRRKRTSPS